MNEHMEDTCTSDLLGYIRSLVLSRIQVNEDQVSLPYSTMENLCSYVTFLT